LPPSTIRYFYGSTCPTPLVAKYPFMDVREGSMGKPSPGWDVQVFDQDERSVAQAGAARSACGPGRAVLPFGYWHNDKASEDTFGCGWFHIKGAATSDEGK
jgi:acetyl-CoA synthetase